MHSSISAVSNHFATKILQFKYICSSRPSIVEMVSTAAQFMFQVGTLFGGEKSWQIVPGNVSLPEQFSDAMRILTDTAGTGSHN